MNIVLFSLNLLFIINNCLAQEYQNITESINNLSKVKRDSASGECKYINSLIGKEESYDCCNYYGIICENNHIVDM